MPQAKCGPLAFASEMPSDWVHDCVDRKKPTIYLGEQDSKSLARDASTCLHALVNLACHDFMTVLFGDPIRSL